MNWKTKSRSRLNSVRLLAVISLLCLSSPALAQDIPPDFEKRIALAEEFVQIQPIRNQVRSAVERYLSAKLRGRPGENIELATAAMMKLINIEALEQISIDSYAEIFTVSELEAMIEYYSKPEAQSARKKMVDLNTRLGPEIHKMMDAALMRTKMQSGQ